MFNKVEQVKHLPIRFGEVARYVIVPGDPNRIPIISKYLDNVEYQGQEREFNASRGTYKGVEVSVVSTGIGCPSTAIAVEELVYLGAEVFIRIGTSGSVDGSAKKGDIFIATAAVRDDGTSKQYMPIEFPAVADLGVVKNLISASEFFSVPSKVGICQSKDSFFGEIDPSRMPISEYLDSKWKAWQGGSVGASEMEAATLFTLSQLFGVAAGAILAIETSDEKTIGKMTNIVLESIYYMEKEKNHV